MGLLQDRVVLITGGARGQGRAHAMRSAQEGADVVLVDITEPVAGTAYRTATAEDMDETVAQVEKEGRRAVAVTGDVRSQQDMDTAAERAVAEFGRIDALVANAGIWSLRPLLELDEQTWSDMIDINLSGVFRSVRATIPHMVERGSGSIVITSSINGLEPANEYAHYVSAKHGLIGLMRNVALEGAPHGVRANAVSPGFIDTPMTDNQRAYDMVGGHEGATREERNEGAYGFHALRGAGALPPEDVADVAVFLNSDLARSVTGTVIPVDAGHMVLPGMNPAPVR
ncbi:mycofactocin-coupled SDR family oxidoreductase [Pseudonocardia sp. KRD-184]|uniref:Mycofactocin-coupled SDR family oxidoreductase n=1 Tax=Pseudonocardia oceani TaxID=2792013 RepID=A0ABS6U8Z8_9PSEU|nr:mycofactocin-coupled SDR family oxidoreductase [Pseudonocardia oceani]MBW0088648.1 mycofactocin-coupled SDR family oxidoreductase [Pseudonocardia oceani]MBW0095532.1 mycofactocin-coupled SDR family oxidoreductase [Pseudonocardia oceani]MBW0108487.1 mycofactocin-coupled SDR family oxidoreductase [Pseudonocardia oceani]MBW0121543.1 mycofactocin-coupled SDR family oxidoreductase [Pseudonocardia oceani]MBW0128724.1 mycofactocin-coupled SDR family oxidoreductase [Pseudonocardia oceani]